MASLFSWIFSGLQILAGIFLTATGAGGGIGIKLIASGVLSLLAQIPGGKARTGLASGTRNGFDNARNVTTLGAPIPVIYGEDVFAPPVISSIVRIEGGRQFAYILLAVSQGEIDSISDVKFNGLPLASFDGAYRIVKRGTASQSASWFKGGSDDGTGGDVLVGGWGQSGLTYSAGTRISGATTVGGTNESHVHVMRAAGDEVWITLRWPSGLYAFTTRGEYRVQTWYGKVWIKGYLEPDTKYVEYLIPKDSSGNRVQGDFSAGQFGPWSTTANQQTDLRRMIVVVLPANGRYAVKIEGLYAEGTAGDRRTPVVSLVTEITNSTRAYENVALLAVKCPDSEQLGGTLPTVTCKVRGIKVLDFRTGTRAWSRNPALCIADFITSTRYGIGDRITMDDLDVGVGGTFRTFADRADALISVRGRPDEARYQLDIVLDTIADVTEWVAAMLTSCNGVLVDVQGLFKLTEDRSYVSTAATFDDSPNTAGSTRHPILRDPDGSSSLSIRLASEDERPNRVILKHFDREQDGRSVQTELRDWALDVGAQTGSDQLAGAQVKGGTSGAVGYLTASSLSTDRTIYYTQDPGAAAFVSGEVVTIGTSSTSTRSSTSAPYRETPERLAAIRLVGVTRITQAQRIGRTVLNSSRRRALYASFATWMRDANLVHNDVIEITSARLGLSSKRFVVIDVEFDFEGKGVVVAREAHDDPFAQVDLTLPKTAAAPIGTAPPAGSNAQATGSGAAAASVSKPAIAASGAAGKPTVSSGSTTYATVAVSFSNTLK